MVRTLVAAPKILVFGGALGGVAFVVVGLFLGWDQPFSWASFLSGLGLGFLGIALAFIVRGREEPAD